jgi:hypothetical protein
MSPLLSACHFRRAGIAFLAAGLLVGCTPRVPLTDPSDPAIPSYSYPAQPVFGGYESMKDLELRDWRQANDTVRTVGGHAGAVKDQEPGGSATPPGGHTGHH